MIDTLVHLIRINNVLSKDEEEFFRKHILYFLDNKNLGTILYQNKRAFGDVCGRRPDFTSYFEDIENFCTEKGINYIYLNEKYINTFWNLVWDNENCQTFRLGNENFTEIGITDKAFLFYAKRGIFLMIYKGNVKRDIINFTDNKNIQWFNDNYDRL